MKLLKYAMSISSPRTVFLPFSLVYFSGEMFEEWSLDLVSHLFWKRGVGSRGPVWQRGPISGGILSSLCLDIFLRTVCWEALFSAQGIQDEAFEHLWGTLARAGDSLSLYYQPLFTRL